jgi:hypothetical protein
MYVRVGGERVRSSEDAEFFLEWLDRLQQAVEVHEEWRTPVEREHVLDLIGRARAVYAGQTLR